MKKLQENYQNKSEMNLSNICQNLAKRDKNVLSVILSGSRARGDYRENSDYDLTFVTKSPIKNYDEELTIEHNYKNKISEKTKIDRDLIQVSVWSFNGFKKEYKRGNSFVYCALRDGKILFSRSKINFKKPTNFRQYALDRLDLAKRNIEDIKFSLKYYKEPTPRSRELEDLGYISMHLCWAVCMFNNHCPISKYTVLKECRKYFSENELVHIKKAYQLYAKKGSKKLHRKTFLVLFNNLKKTMKRVEKKYVEKQEIFD
tara:strand:+ start:3743 stop:4519 length:777 start_codon:yes stop_codon:yes gene_type:complete